MPTTEEIQQNVHERIEILRDEIDKLERARDALTPDRAHTTRRRLASRSTGRSRGRPQGSGKRAEQTAKIVAENPGITINDIAKRLRIKPNYLYRVMPQLQKDGLVKKQGDGWVPGRKAQTQGEQASAETKPRRSRPSRSRTKDNAKSKDSANSKTQSDPKTTTKNDEKKS